MLNEEQYKLLMLYIGEQSDHLKFIINYNDINLGTKILYLERAITITDEEEFNSFIHKLYLPPIVAIDKQKNAEYFIYLLKLINDLCSSRIIEHPEDCDDITAATLRFNVPVTDSQTTQEIAAIFKKAIQQLITMLSKNTRENIARQKKFREHDEYALSVTNTAPHFKRKVKEPLYRLVNNNTWFIEHQHSKAPLFLAHSNKLCALITSKGLIRSTFQDLDDLTPEKTAWLLKNASTIVAIKTPIPLPTRALSSILCYHNEPTRDFALKLISNYPCNFLALVPAIITPEKLEALHTTNLDYLMDMFIYANIFSYFPTKNDPTLKKTLLELNSHDLKKLSAWSNEDKEELRTPEEKIAYLNDLLTNQDLLLPIPKKSPQKRKASNNLNIDRNNIMAPAKRRPATSLLPLRDMSEESLSDFANVKFYDEKVELLEQNYASVTSLLESVLLYSDFFNLSLQDITWILRQEVALTIEFFDIDHGLDPTNYFFDFFLLDEDKRDFAYTHLTENRNAYIFGVFYNELPYSFEQLQELSQERFEDLLDYYDVLYYFGPKESGVDINILLTINAKGLQFMREQIDDQEYAADKSASAEECVAAVLADPTNLWHAETPQKPTSVVTWANLYKKIIEREDVPSTPSPTPGLE